MGVTDPQADVLKRFAAADSALRRVHEELSALALARSGAEGAAGSLSAASDAVAEFAQQVQEATVSALDVQASVRGALEEIRSVSRAFDVSTLLREVRSTRQEISDMTEALAQVAERVRATDARVDALQGDVSQAAESTSSLVSRLDALGMAIGRQIEVEATRVCATVEAGRRQAQVGATRTSNALRTVANDADAATKKSAVLLAAVETRLAGAIAEVETTAGGQIDGIVDALPRRSKRKLGL